MSYELLTDLVDKLHDESPRVRLRAVRRLGALADPGTIPELSNVYLNEDETPAVRKAAAESLGVFRAMKEALDRNENVEIPDPSTVKEPRFSPEALKRLLIVLAAIMVLLWIANGVLAVMPPGGGTGGAGGQSGDQLRADLERRYAQVAADVANQRAAWQQMVAVNVLKCDVPAPTSAGLTPLQIEFSAHPELFQANLALGDAATRLSLAAGNWTLGCNRPELLSATAGTENLAFVEQAAQSLAQARVYLDQAATSAPVVPTTEAPTAGPTDALAPQPTTDGGAAGEATPVPPPVGETPVPPTSTPLALDLEAYRVYIVEMRDRVDGVTAARGAVTLLGQYWADVRNTGQSFGCSQPFDTQELADYTAITPDVAALDPRLSEIQSTMNIGYALLRDSLANFQQGCTTRDFSLLLTVGEQRVQQAGNAFNQASLLLTELQTEIAGAGS